MSLILLDVWETLKEIGKSTWILDAYGFLGPAFYFYILSKTDDVHFLTKKQALLFLPGVLELFVQITRIFDYRLFNTYYIFDSQYAWVLEILEIISFAVCIVLFSILLKDIFKRNKKIIRRQDVFAFTWIHFINIIIWSIFLVAKFSEFSVLSYILISIIPIGIIILLSQQIQNPEFLNRSLSLNKRKLKIQKSSRAQNDLDQIVTFLKKEKPYLNQDFNLKQLSTTINFPKDYISELLNHKLGKSFRFFVSELRVKEAQSMLQDKNYEHLSSLGIGFEVGFRSESTFYSAFKKITGVTPKIYKKGINSENAF